MQQVAITLQMSIMTSDPQPGPVHPHQELAGDFEEEKRGLDLFRRVQMDRLQVQTAFGPTIGVLALVLLLAGIMASCTLRS